MQDGETAGMMEGKQDPLEETKPLADIDAPAMLFALVCCFARLAVTSFPDCRGQLDEFFTDDVHLGARLSMM